MPYVHTVVVNERSEASKSTPIHIGISGVKTNVSLLAVFLAKFGASLIPNLSQNFEGFAREERAHDDARVVAFVSSPPRAKAH